MNGCGGRALNWILEKIHAERFLEPIRREYRSFCHELQEELIKPIRKEYKLFCEDIDRINAEFVARGNFNDLKIVTKHNIFFHFKKITPFASKSYSAKYFSEQQSKSSKCEGKSRHRVREKKKLELI